MHHQKCHSPIKWFAELPVDMSAGSIKQCLAPACYTLLASKDLRYMSFMTIILHCGSSQLCSMVGM